MQRLKRPGKSKLNKYVLIAIGVIVVFAAVVPGVMAFEGDRINIKAHVKGDTSGTRTPGWWKTHPDAVEWLLIHEIPAGEIDMGWPEEPVDNLAKVMGIFWANQKFETDCDGSKGDKRDDLCFRRMQASFQVLAAILNSYSPNGATLPVSMEYIRTTMGGEDENAILALNNLLDAFNNSREMYPLCIDGGYLDTINDADRAKEVAWLQFANCELPDCP